MLKNPVVTKELKPLIKLLYPIFVVGMVIQSTSCGTLLYPERRGQKGGTCDPAVVLMDGIGVFFFIIPGIMAFVVDFYTGAIYLPEDDSTNTSSFSADNGLAVIENNPDELNQVTIEKIVSRHFRHPIDLASKNIRVYELDYAQDIPVRIASVTNNCD